MLRVLLGIVWASPASIVGLMLGGFAIGTGGRGRRCGRTIEFCGGWLPGLLARVPIRGGAAAVTLGHVILGRDAACLDRCRTHERVHVRQYERWGLLFLPAYALSSGWQWLRGRDAYRDNRFEREAYGYIPNEPRTK